MEVTKKRRIKSGSWYKKFVPEPIGGTVVIKTSAGVRDTVNFIPCLIGDTLEDTRLLALKFKGSTLRKTCRKVFNFVFDHIRYRKDRAGVEEVRRPARTLWDQVGDCDCMATLIGSILTNLKIAYSLRVTKYMGRSFFQHIYVIVPDKKGSHITIDPVVDWFDYEEPFTGKMDIPMDLHYLNGPEVDSFPVPADDEFDVAIANIDSVDIEDLFDAEDLEGLGLFRRKRRRSGGARPPKKKKKKKKRSGPRVKRCKAAHAINKFNPATILLRTGVLAAAKLGVPKKMWGKLLYGLLTEAEARRKGLNMENWAKVKKTLDRVKHIFTCAGGKPQNLVKALVKGKVNRKMQVIRPGQAVAGLGEFETDFNENSSLLEILGPELYNEEIVKPQIQSGGMNGPLGEVATGAALAAAMTALGAIAAAVAKIGPLLKKKQGGGVEPVDSKTPSMIDPDASLPTRGDDTLFPPDGGSNKTDSGSFDTDSTGTDSTDTSNDSGEDDKDEKKDKGLFQKKNMPYIIVGGVGVLALGIWGATKLLKPKKPVNGLDGTGGEQDSDLAGKPRRRKPKTGKKKRPNSSAPRRRRKSSAVSGKPKKSSKKTAVNLN